MFLLLPALVFPLSLLLLPVDFPLSLLWFSLPGLSQQSEEHPGLIPGKKNPHLLLPPPSSAPGSEQPLPFLPLPLFPSPFPFPIPIPSLEPPERPHNVLSSLSPQHWELLVLEKLKWDLVSVIANDFLAHILHRLPLPADKVELVKKHAQTFIALCATGGCQAGLGGAGTPGMGCPPLLGAGCLPSLPSEPFQVG